MRLKTNRKVYKATTRKWTDEQRKAIENHQRPKFNGQTLHSHHTYSVAKYPHLVNIGAIIYPATPNEHRHGWQSTKQFT